MGNQDINQWTENAFKYGPFFFSILFVIFLTRWAYKKYDKAITKNPPLDLKDKTINRTMFMTTFIFGLILVVVSVVWWWWFKPDTYVFKGRIRNVQPQEEFYATAEDFYVKKLPHPSITDEENQGLLRDDRFIILKPHPFRKAQPFRLTYKKDHREHDIWITYDPSEEEPEYEVAYDDTNKRSYFRRPRPDAAPLVKTESALQWEETVLAAEPSQSADPHQSDQAMTDMKLVAILQDTKSGVATKLDAIDILNNKEALSLRHDLELGVIEPFALTILDLTQHSDAELAAKATNLAKRADIDSYLVELLSSDNAEKRSEAEKTLLRISRPHARSILARVQTQEHEDVRRVSLDIASGKNQVLKPTGTSAGDRYYVKATWNPANAKVVACLTKLYNQELETTRNLKDEQQLMQGKTQRYVYWSSKDWALSIAKDIKKCGGTPEFVLGR